MKLIGFRTDKMWKKIVACIGYVFIVLIFITSLTEDTIVEAVMLDLQYLSLGLPIILAFAKLEFLKRKLPLLKEKKLIPRVLGVFIWSFVVIFISIIIFYITIVTTEKFYPIEKQAEIEQRRVENLASKSNQSTTNTEINTESNVTEMVWVAKTGYEYHSHNDCGNSRTAQISLESAKARGLEACKTCH